MASEQPAQSATKFDPPLTALLLLAFISLALTKLMSANIWWQIKTGEWVLSHGFPATDPFSYAFPDRPWVEPRWLFCVVVYAVHAWLGVNGLLALKVLVLFAAAVVLSRLQSRAPRAIVNLALACALLVAHRRFFVRPEMFTYVLLAGYLLAWHRWRDGGTMGWLLALPGLQILWSNSHSIAVLGPLVLGILWMSEAIAGWWSGDRLGSGRLLAAAAVTLVVALACCATPYGVDGALFPFQLLSQIGTNDPLNEMIDEFRSPLVDAGFNVFFGSFVAVVVLSLATFALADRRQVIARLPLWAAFLVLSFLAYRNIALFGVVVAYVVILNLDDYCARRPRGERALITAAQIFCAGLAIYLSPAAISDAYYRSERIGQRFGIGVSNLHFPIRALQFADAHDVPRPLLNDLGDGGYVLYRHGPKSVFVDGRLEVYGGAILYDAVKMLQTGVGFDERTRQLGVDTVLLRHRRQAGLFAVLQRSREWVPVYYDHTHIVYVRVNERTQPLRQQFQIDWRNPPEPGRGSDGIDAIALTWPQRPDAVEMRDLAALYLDVGNVGLARDYFERALAIYPAEENSRLHLGMIYRCEGRDGDGDRLLRDADPERLASVHFQRLLAQICLNLGKPQRALDALEQAVEAGGKRIEDYRLLASVAMRVPDLRRALAALQAITRADPSDGASWNGLGEVALRSGDTTRARDAFERALALDPADARARQGLASLSR